MVHKEVGKDLIPAAGTELLGILWKLMSSSVESMGFYLGSVSMFTDE